jgi:Bacterial regulatory helix-turn-helix protein, lysR family
MFITRNSTRSDFAAVAEAGSFTKAAQPARSASIAKLEEKVGVKLFHRSSRVRTRSLLNAIQRIVLSDVRPQTGCRLRGAAGLRDRGEVPDLVKLQLINHVYSTHKNIRFHLWRPKD